MSNSKGFTLVELAIVLVIIGVILGGVVKGTELVKNARMKRLYMEFQNIQTATMTYFERTGQIPGDTATGTPAVRDNRIDDNTNFWNELRTENLWTGADGDAVNHVFGGSITATAGISGTAVLGWSDNNLACFNSVGTDVARAVDNQFDDGDPDAGNIRIGASDAATGATTGTEYPTGTAPVTMCVVIE